MNLAVNTDILSSTGAPGRILKLISEAGFTHLHWCHHWNDDFLYSRSEIAEIKKQLKTLHLSLLDIHGSAGWEKCWYSPVEYERISGVELVVNRIEMLRELDGTGTVMMHIPCFRTDTTQEGRQLLETQFSALRRSLDELMPVLDRHDCVIAVENMWNDTWESHARLLAEYPADRLGICYDSGHANGNPAQDRVRENRARLQALHLHDNDGISDLHQPPFEGTVDWMRVAETIAASGYGRELSFELSIRNTPFAKSETPPEKLPDDVAAAFLCDAHDRCFRFALMVELTRA